MSDQPALDLKFFPVPDQFVDCITTIYRLEVDLPSDDVLTDLLLPEWSNLRFLSHSARRQGHLDGQPLGEGGFFATGPTNRPISFSIGKSRLWGFGLLPLGWASFVRAPASTLVNLATDGSTHPAFRHFAPIAAALEEAAIDDWSEYRLLCDGLSEQFRPPRDEERIRAVQVAMVDPYLLQIPDFAERAGVSVRTLERVCLKSFGFSPNVVLRRQRLVRSLASFMVEDEARWSETIDRHYHDQPHFVREFHHFMGMSPTEYAAQDHPIMRAFMANRQKVWGTPVRVTDVNAASTGV
ncbi:helix-turn-helix domain-containing protein [Parerythrobacter aestuarii]|uniref:helix-turn-helix domain-containing protein n=1 Tax=Parerythrobacter aestuarii TaxID=3020909 RepID=UPI0024DE80B2|nr:helix-turn-helix domain-containing protein [Parerythrobacter aestuarii]